MRTHRTLSHHAEPTAGELAQIEAEEPLIAAELDVLDAEIALISASRPSALDWRRLRRAQAQLIRTWIETTHTRTPARCARSGEAA